MIYTFVALPAERMTAVGGKGGTLAKLYQQGYPVPDGFVIAPEAFARHELRDEAWTAVQTHLQALRQGDDRATFAVRSSALSEDSALASFAGSFESVLDVSGNEEIYRAIHTVRHSAENARVHAYSQAQGLSGAHQVAVIIQKLVRPDYAGVLFTADPVSGSHAYMAGNFVSGLGDRLVSGEATPQTFTLARPNGAYNGPKQMKRPGRLLFKLAQKVEEALGGPQDIEWAVASGKVHLLQARPITTMQPYNPATGEWNDTVRGEYLWTNANFGEAVPDIMTPMTWSMLQIYGRETFTIPLPGNHPLFGNIGGRFYMNASLAASMFTALGFSQARIQAHMREFFGYLPENTKLSLIPFSRWSVLRAFLKNAPAAMRRVRRDRRNLATFTTAVPAQTAHFQQQISQAQNTDDLLVVWAELLPYFCQTCRMLQAGTGHFDDLVRPLRQKLLKLADEETSNALLSGFSQAHTPLASLGPLVGLWQVAQGQMSQAEYARQYGHRGPHEFELSWPRPAEDPQWMAQQLANVGAVDVPALLARQEAAKQAAWGRFANQHPRRARKIRPRLKAITAAAQKRENIRSEMVRLLAVLRAFALRAGTLTGLGEDIFFLRLEELTAVLHGRQSEENCIPVRKQAHARLSALPLYPGVIYGRFNPYQPAQEPEERAESIQRMTITGFPGAAGIVEGVVRRLDAPEESALFQSGEILVTATTNVGWTSLFPKAAAIITDVGAPLSHAAIVARELGIPAVVGTGNATRRLQTGDRVRVNGVKGVVELLP